MYRITARNAPRACKASCGPSRSFWTTTPFFPQVHHSPFGAFNNDIFRILDSATADLTPQASGRRALRSFTPRFDVKEASSAYELQGELPGFEQKDLDIEFVDERTLVIKGRHTYTDDTSTEDQQHQTSATEDVSDTASQKSANYQKPTVEDEYVDAGAESQEPEAQASPNEATKTEQSGAVTAQPQAKYWVSERSTGEFERRFAFPGRVNQDEVKASLKNGILSIVVPKLVEKETKRIAIE